MLFDKEMDVQMIKLIEMRPELYDKTHAGYRNKNVKDLLWEEIAALLDNPDVNGEKCKRRWLNIRDALLTAQKKNHETPYKYAELLKFVNPFIQPIMCIKPRVKPAKDTTAGIITGKFESHEMILDESSSFPSESSGHIRVFDAEMDIKLIQLIEARPALYDKRNPVFKGCVEKALVWQEVADLMGNPPFTVENCKLRWAHIRDALLLANKRENSDLRPYKYAQHLQFILPYLRVRSELKLLYYTEPPRKLTEEGGPCYMRIPSKSSNSEPSDEIILDGSPSPSESSSSPPPSPSPPSPITTISVVNPLEKEVASYTITPFTGRKRKSEECVSPQSGDTHSSVYEPQSQSFNEESQSSNEDSQSSNQPEQSISDSTVKDILKYFAEKDKPDPVRDFLMGAIAPALRSLPRHLFLKAKKEIFEAVHKYEMIAEEQSGDQYEYTLGA
ncbi:hypothetical protein M8J75_004657 [Diaphorina citri]|nr:hypothetical protein M8J75_004657 [Diaphorina citri]